MLSAELASGSPQDEVILQRGEVCPLHLIFLIGSNFKIPLRDPVLDRCWGACEERRETVYE